MDKNVEYSNQPGKPASKKSNANRVWNLLSVAMLVATLCVCVFFFNLFTNPYSFLNPFPPPTIVPTPIPPTPTPLGMEPTWTPTVTIEPTATNTPRPTWTLEPTNTTYKLVTPTEVITETITTTPTKTKKPDVRYEVTVKTYESTAFLPNSSCDTMYVVGQALDAKNNPMLGLMVRLGGSVPGKVITEPQVQLTGIYTAYGPSGFEFNLGVKPASSSKTLWIQLLDQSFNPLSDQTFLATYTDCKKNMIYVRFQQK